MNDEEKLVLDCVRKELASLYDIFESKTFITSIYLLKFLDDGDITYYNKYLMNMEKLNLTEKRQVFMNIIVNLKEKEKKDKTKIKK